jgi:hypothetical protein
MKPRNQRGRPKPPAKPNATAGSKPAFMKSPVRNSEAPSTTEMMINCCLLQDRPACVILVVSATRFAFLLLSSTSFSDSSTCCRRERCAR